MDRPTEAPLLALRNLKTRFYTYEGTVQALDGIEFDIARGETFGLVGETGCGKSVTALSVMRLIPSPPGKIEEGEVLFLLPQEKWDRIGALEARLEGTLSALRSSLRKTPPVTGSDRELLEQLNVALGSNPPRFEVPVLNRIQASLHDTGREPDLREGARNAIRELVATKSPHDILTRPEDNMRKIRGNLVAMIFQEPMSALNPVIVVGDQIAENIILHQKEILAKEVLGDLDRDLMMESQPRAQVVRRSEDDVPRCGNCQAELPERASADRSGGVFVSRWRRESRPGVTLLRLATLFYLLSIPVAVAAAKALVEVPVGSLITWGQFFDALGRSGAMGLLILGILIQLAFAATAFFASFPRARKLELSIPLIVMGAASNAVSLLFFGGVVGAIGGTFVILGAIAGRRWQKFPVAVDACPRCHYRFSGPPWSPVLRQVPIRITRFLYQRMAKNPNDILLAVVSRVPVLRRYERVFYGFAIDRAIEMLRQVRMPDPEKVADSYPFELSGGMAQRAMIAIALSCSPRLLIADEPTTAVDVTIQAQVLKLMRDLKERVAASILLITHNLGVVAETCDRVGVMYAGVMAEIGPTRSVFKEALHPYTKGLMESIPRVTVEKDRLQIIRGNVPNLIKPPAGCRFHPRCPAVMAHCGWASDEIRTRLEDLLEKVPGDGAVQRLIRKWDDSDRGVLVVECRGRAKTVADWVTSAIAQWKGEDVAFQAVESVKVDGEEVALRLISQRKPPMIEARPGHQVACYLYGGWPRD